MGLKKNVLYSGFLTTSLYFFQLLTYPYVARVLGVTNIGICNYVQSIVDYVSLFCMLGITTVGVREIAKCNGDEQKIEQTFSRLFMFSAIITFFVLSIYLIVIMTVPQLEPYQKLLGVGALQLFCGLFTVEWLFRGLEKFKYVTLRTLVVRVLYVISIFLFVRDRDDYFVYFIIYSGMIIAGGVVNWVYRMKFVKFSLQPLHTLKKDVAPLLFLGARMILTSVYTTFNTIYLGLFCGDVQVGYYTTAIKLQNIILALYSSFTLVMMPRVSALMAERDETGVKRMLQQSFDLLFAFVFPCILFVEFYAEELVYLVAGEGFEGSVLPMRVVMPLMPIIGLEQILIIQILIPHRADKKVFVSTVVGALCSMVLNVLIVEKLQSVGSAIVWFMSELIVMLMALYFVDQRYRDLLSVQESVKYIVIFSPLSLLLFLVSVSFPSVWLCFGIGVLLTLIYSHIVLHYLIKNETYIKCVEMLQKRIDRSHILAR